MGPLRGFEPRSAAYETAILPVELQRHASAPKTALFLFWGKYPGPRISRNFTREGAAVAYPSCPGIGSPPRVAHFFTAKRESRPRRPEFATAKRESRRAARTSSRRSAKADNGGRLCPAQGFSGRAAGRNGALPYNARKSQFLRNGDVWATESLFLFAVLWLAFLPDQSETGVAGGGKARRPETPAAPRRPRPTTATGSRFLRRQRKRPPRRPRPSPPAREGSLGAPNDRTFPPGAERKARKEKGKEEPRMKRAPPL